MKVSFHFLLPIIYVCRYIYYSLIDNLLRFSSLGSLNGNGNEKQPVSAQESLDLDHNSDEDGGRRPTVRSNNIEVTITDINGHQCKRMAPLEFGDDDSDSGEDNEHSRMTTSTRRMGGSSRRDSNCSSDSIMSDSNV